MFDDIQHLLGLAPISLLLSALRITINFKYKGAKLNIRIGR